VVEAVEQELLVYEMPILLLAVMVVLELQVQFLVL
jgi:hypothetical protein